MSTTLTSRPDPVLVEAVEMARAAAVDEAGSDQVGDYLGYDTDDERVVTHRFASRHSGYRGWAWAVTVARAPRAKTVTVDEVVLLPGEGALLAPQWLPWSERLQPGDLGVGDVLPTPADDARLVPAYASVDDAEAEEVAYELGFGRVRVLSLEGRDRAVDRWYAGDAGPRSPMARAAPAICATCGFYVPLSGALRQLFGACTNEFVPDDGEIVSADHGCGGHSEAAVVDAMPKAAEDVVDEFGYEPLAPEPGPGSVADDESPEPFGHS